MIKDGERLNSPTVSSSCLVTALSRFESRLFNRYPSLVDWVTCEAPETSCTSTTCTRKVPRSRFLLRSSKCSLAKATASRFNVASHYRDAEDEKDFNEIHALLRRGDIVGVTGTPSRTKKGELSISPSKIILLSPCLHMLPKTTDGGLTDVEIRYRKRHLDLIMHNNVRNIFMTRSKVVNYVRKYLDSMGFMEVSG